MAKYAAARRRISFSCSRSDGDVRVRAHIVRRGLEVPWAATDCERPHPDPGALGVDPDKEVPPFVLVELVDGIVWKGSVTGFDVDPKDDQRSRALGPPVMRKRPGDGSFERKTDSRVVVLPESQIGTFQLIYPAPDVAARPDDQALRGTS